MSVPVNGSQVIEAISSKIDAKLQEAKRGFINYLADVAGPQLSQLGISPENSRLRFAVKALPKASDGPVLPTHIEHFRSFMPVLKNAPEVQVGQLCQTLFEAEVREKERLTHAERSEGALINAILRPLELEPFWLRKQKDLDPNFNAEALESRVNELRNTVIESPTNLRMWAEDVAIFFETSIVAKENEDDRRLGRQVGRIGLGSWRIYRQAWFNYIQSESESILEIARNFDPESPRRRTLISPISHDSNSSEYSYAALSPVRMFAQARRPNFENVSKSAVPDSTVSVAITFDGSRGSHTWASFRQAESEIHKWIQDVTELYDGQRSRADLTVEFVRGDAKSEYNFVEIAAENLEKKVRQVIEIASKGSGN